MSLFPIFLKLTGRPCIVLGAGDIAESKIDSLRAAEARVIVIAPAASARIIELSSSGEIIWHQREYAQGDLAGHFLAVAATNNSAVIARSSPRPKLRESSSTQWTTRPSAISIFPP